MIASRLDALSTASSARLLAWVGTTWAVCSLELVVFTFTRALVDRDIGMGRLTLQLLGASTAIGSIIGGPLFGWIADARGRRTSLVLAMTVSLLGLVLFAMARSQAEVLTARVVAAIGIGGQVPASVVLLQELVPRHRRVQSAALLPAFAGVGGVLGVLLAFFVAPAIGWRGLYAALSSLLLLVAVICMNLVESPPWLLDVGRMDEALATIEELEMAGKSSRGTNRDVRMPLLGAEAPRPGVYHASPVQQDATRPAVLVLLLLWTTFPVTAFALGTFLPSLISLTGLNVFALWYTCSLLFAVQIVGSGLASTLLDRLQGRNGDHDSTANDCKAVLAVSAVVTAVVALGVSYLPSSASGATVTTGVSLVSAFLASTWSAVLAYTPSRFPAACRGRSVGFLVASGGVGGVFGAVVVFPRFYNVWMLSIRALAWIFGAVLLIVAAVLVPRFGRRLAAS